MPRVFCILLETLCTSACKTRQVLMWDQTAVSLCKVLPLCHRSSWRKLCTHETTRAKSTLRLPRKTLTPQNIYTENVWGINFRFHTYNSHVVHRASKKSHLENYFFVLWRGRPLHTKNSRVMILASLLKIHCMRLRPLHRNIPSKSFM